MILPTYLMENELYQLGTMVKILFLDGSKISLGIKKSSFSNSPQEHHLCFGCFKVYGHEAIIYFDYYKDSLSQTMLIIRWIGTGERFYRATISDCVITCLNEVQKVAEPIPISKPVPTTNPPAKGSQLSLF